MRKQDPNAQLFQAVRQNDPDLIQTAIAAGADIEARDENGQTPIYWALRHAAAQALIAAGADIDARNNDDRTPLHNQVYDSYESAFDLIAAGADPTACDSFSNTPLHFVSDPKKASALISAGADVNALNRADATPLEVIVSRPDPLLNTAAEVQFAATAEVLLAAGATVDPATIAARIDPIAASFDPRPEVFRSLAAHDAKQFPLCAARAEALDRDERWRRAPAPPAMPSPSHPIPAPARDPNPDRGMDR